ncbi:MAG: ThiF family adenylyltransferase [Candidatus Binatia bacterium]
MLTDVQIERYSRQIILPQIGGRGQQRILSGSVAVVASSETGSAAASYLAAAGVGQLGIVEATRTHGWARALAAELAALNPDCRVQLVREGLTADAAAQIAGTHDVVIVGNASLDTSSLLNTACVALKTPLVWASTTGAMGSVMTCAGHRSDAPCYQCLYVQEPAAASGAQQPSALERVTAAFVGALQATETLTLLLHLGASSVGQLLSYDALNATVHQAAVGKDPACGTCGPGARGQAVTG